MEKIVEAEKSSALTIWLWVLQRLTAVLLILLLATHIWVGHFAYLEEFLAGRWAEIVVFENVHLRLRTLLFMVIDFSLLAAVLYHALYGVRSVVLDFGIGPRAQRILSWALLILGVGTFIYGANALWPFITGSTLF